MSPDLHNIVSNAKSLTAARIARWTASSTVFRSVSTIALSCSLFGCSGECAAPAPEPGTNTAAISDQNNETMVITGDAVAVPASFSFRVTGMHCEGCEGAICDKVGKVAGVVSVKASHMDEKVDVEVADSAPAEARAAIVAAIKKLGYQVVD